MRFLQQILIVVSSALMSAGAWAQSASSPAVIADQALRALAEGARTQVSVVVREQNGTQLVEVTMLNGLYPPDSLRAQCIELARLVGSDARALTIFDSAPQNPAASMRKARFGVTGLIDLTRGTVRIEPIVKAFVGEPDPYATEGMLIAFAGVTPGPATLRTHKSDAVAVYGSATTSPPGIEYKVRVLKQDASQISIPDSYVPPSKQKTMIVKEPRTIWPAIVLLIIGSVAAGCLVYFALVGGSKRIPPAPVRKGAPRHDD